MKNIFFIGDTHFGHSNILKFEPGFRPFKTIEEHDEELIMRWNETVLPQDTVYHLGDFCLNARFVPIARRLNGRKILVMGNHDVFGAKTYLENGFDDVVGCLPLGGFILTHMPVNANQLEYRFYKNIHGHMHSKRLADDRYINVSCEQIDLRPIHVDEILRRYPSINLMQRRPQNG